MDKLERRALGQEEKPWPQSLIEKDELEKWQKYICGLSNVFLCAVDENGVPLTELGGNPQETEKIERLIDGEQFQSMLGRVAESELEDRAVERTAYPNLRLAVATSRVEKKPAVNWLVCGIMDDSEDAGEYENLPPFEERKMDFFLPATYDRPEKYEWEIAQAIPDIQDGIWNIIEQMKKKPGISMEEALEKMLVDQEMDCLDRNGKATVFHAHFLADMYINAYYRERAVKELLKSGIRLYVCGQGWEQFEGEGKENLTIIPAVDFKEISGLMQQAKIVLNIAYAFKNGCHDRVLSTMLAGAVSVTSENPYMKSHFSEDEIVFYQMEELEKLPVLLQNLVKDEARLKDIARRGYEKAAKSHTWQIRAKELMELADIKSVFT